MEPGAGAQGLMAARQCPIAELPVRPYVSFPCLSQAESSVHQERLWMCWEPLLLDAQIPQVPTDFL